MLLIFQTIIFACCCAYLSRLPRLSFVGVSPIFRGCFAYLSWVLRLSFVGASLIFRVLLMDFPAWKFPITILRLCINNVSFSFFILHYQLPFSGRLRCVPGAVGCLRTVACVTDQARRYARERSPALQIKRGVMPAKCRLRHISGFYAIAYHVGI